MTVFLKQSTEIKVRIGPFKDYQDGVTLETGVTLSGADQAELLKANGAATVDISGATWAAVTGANGMYDLTLTTSHTDTVGELVVLVGDANVCIPVTERFQVVEENVYDKFFAASASGGTDIAAILVDTADMQPKLGTPAGASISADIAAIEAQTDDIGVAGAGLTAITGVLGTPADTDLATDIAAVRTEVDVLNDAQTEPTGVPAANATPMDKLGFLYMMARNKITITSSKKTYFGDDDAAEFEKDLTDDGTTYTESEANAI